jgi:hypothetical protein
MKSFITQTLLISSLMLSIAYAGDKKHKGPPMDEATKAAFEACATEVEMPDRDSGERPTKEQHEAMKACLTKKGIALPEHGPGGRGRGGGPGGPPPPRENDESEE